MPLTRSCVKRTAIRTVNIGAAACRIAARLESILVSAQEKQRNGIAVLIRPTRTIGNQFARAWRTTVRPPARASATGTRTTAPSPTRKNTSAAGLNCRSATLMNMNDAPQISERAAIMTASRRLILVL